MAEEQNRNYQIDKSTSFIARHLGKITLAMGTIAVGAFLYALNTAYHADKAGDIAIELKTIDNRVKECDINIESLTKKINETASYMQYCSGPKCISDLNDEELFPLIKELSATTATCNPIYIDAINRKPELLKQVHLESKLAWNPFYNW
jgi:hypothetical protein